MLNNIFIYSKNFFYNNAKIRFNCKLDELKSRGNKPKIGDITLSNQSLISLIKNGKINKNNLSFIPDSVAKEIQVYFERENIPYKDNFEIFWGNKEELQKKELEFFYCLMKDMLNIFYKKKERSVSYSILVQNMLKHYVEYAELLSILNIEMLYRIKDITKETIPKEIKYHKEDEFKETGLKIPKDIYFFTENDENSCLYTLTEGNQQVFTNTKIEDAIEIENKAIVYCYEKFFKDKVDIHELFFEYLYNNDSHIKRKKNNKNLNKRIEDPYPPTFEVIEKFLTNFIEKNIIPLLKDNSATTLDTGFGIHDNLFYQYIKILQLHEKYIYSSKSIYTKLEKKELIYILDNNKKKVKKSIPIYDLKKEYKYEIELLEYQKKYLKFIKNIFKKYKDNKHSDNLYKKIIDYSKYQFKITNIDSLIKEKKIDIFSLELRYLANEKELLLGSVYNLYF